MKQTTTATESPFKGQNFHRWALSCGFILIRQMIEKYSKEPIYIAVKECKGFFGKYYTFGRIYSICGDYDYYQQGMITFANHRDAVVAACEFFGIK